MAKLAATARAVPEHVTAQGDDISSALAGRGGPRNVDISYDQSLQPRGFKYPNTEANMISLTVSRTFLYHICDMDSLGSIQGATKIPRCGRGSSARRRTSKA